MLGTTPPMKCHPGTNLIYLSSPYLCLSGMIFHILVRALLHIFLHHRRHDPHRVPCKNKLVGLQFNAFGKIG